MHYEGISLKPALSFFYALETKKILFRCSVFSTFSPLIFHLFFVNLSYFFVCFVFSLLLVIF